MSYEGALQRVGELRALMGEAPTASATGATAAIDGAFDAELAQQAALLRSGADGADADGEFGQFGVPVLSVADQYRMLGIPVPVAGAPGFPPTGGAVGQRMVALATAELGVSETGGSNESPRIREYRSATAGAEGTPGPWCAYFVSWLAKGAGAPIGAGGNGTGYVPTLEAWGKQEGRYFQSGQGTPQPGDIVIINWGRSGVADHTGIVERVDVDGTVHTIEGNSSNAVRRQEYAATSPNLQGFIRVG